MSDQSSEKMYYHITNASGKEWILPRRGLRTALEIYQPGSLKGRLLKSMLPLLHRLSFVRSPLGIKLVDWQLPDGLDAVLTKCFAISPSQSAQVSKHSDDLKYSVFLGTPSVNKKTTIQISRGDDILGYCKISDSEHINELFAHEKQMLDFLHSRELSRIPSCLFCGEYAPGHYAFVQTSVKSRPYSVEHHLTPAHWDFLNEMASIVSSEVLPDVAQTAVASGPLRTDHLQSDFLKILRTAQSWPETYLVSDLLQDSIKDVIAYYSASKDVFSAYHGDFTPWNTLLKDGKVYAFDFEYSGSSFPAFMDACHFVSESSRLEKHLTPKDTYDTVIEALTGHVSNPRMLYLAYLTYISVFYINLYEGSLSFADGAYSYWQELMSIAKSNPSDNVK